MRCLRVFFEHSGRPEHHQGEFPALKGRAPISKRHEMRARPFAVSRAPLRQPQSSRRPGGRPRSTFEFSAQAKIPKTGEVIFPQKNGVLWRVDRFMYIVHKNPRWD
jgi:hypothetical protein